MGVSTNGQLCFGVILKEEQVYPWEGYPDFDYWWLYEVDKFEHLFDKGTDGYYAEQCEYLRTQPPKYSLVNYCSSNEPMLILSLAKVTRIARRGYPASINQSGLHIDSEEIKQLIDFCVEHGLEIEGEPGWWLSSYRSS